MHSIKQYFQSYNSIKERKFLLIVSGLIVLALLTAFVLIYMNVNQVIQATRRQTETQASYVSEGLESAFYNYSRLCSIVGANQNVAKYSEYGVSTSEDKKVSEAREIMKVLSSLVSIYGSEMNTLAVYFPQSQTVVTMARYLPKDETQVFLDREENEFLKQCITSESLGTASETYHNLRDENHCFFVRYALTTNGQPVYILVDVNISVKTESLRGLGSDTRVILRDEQGNMFDTSGVSGQVDFQSFLQAARMGETFREDGSLYYCEAPLTRYVGIDAVVAVPLDAAQAIQKDFVVVLILTAIIVLFMIFYLGEAMNRKVFKPLESIRSPQMAQAVDVQSLIQQVNTDMGTLVKANLRYQQERKQMLPLALGRLLNRLMDEGDPSQQGTLAYSCLTMAGVDDAPYYAMYAIGCTCDPNKILEATKEPNTQSRMVFLQFLIDNVLAELVNPVNRGVVAPIRKDWMMVLAPCASEEDGAELERVNQTLQEFFKSQFDMTLVTSAVLMDNGTAYFADHVKEIRNNSLFMEFWGNASRKQETYSGKNNFLYYCSTMRKILDRVTPENLNDSISLLDTVIHEAFPPDLDSILQARNRMQTLGAVAISDISDKYRENPEFLTSLDLEPLQWCRSIGAFREEFLRILTALSQTKPDGGEPGGTAGSRMAEIKEYIVAHYTDNELNVTSLAKQFNYSVPYLSRSFKDVYNINVLEFIQRMRVSHAKEILSENSVKVTASLSGFWDEQALVRTFRKYEGITPAEYKKLTVYGGERNTEKTSG